MRPQLVRVNSELDLAGLKIGELVMVSFDYGHNNRWTAYNGQRKGKERFIGPTAFAVADPKPIISLWEHQAEHLEFSNGMILLDRDYLQCQQFGPEHPEYDRIYPFIDRARAYL